MEVRRAAARRAEIKLRRKMAFSEMLCLMAASDEMAGFPRCGTGSVKEESRFFC